MHTQRGMTLIELSIVIVIVGLIVGGISVGSSMRYNSRVQDILADKASLQSAIDSYKTKFSAIPGDHIKAESVFGVSATDNGNDNGVIDHPGVNNDSWLMWQHLALADLWKGKFTGDNGPSATNTQYDGVIGTNLPSSAFEGVGYSVWYESTTNNNLGATPQRHFFVVGKDSSTNNYTTFGGWISPADLAAIDSKYDDGIANSGDIRTHVALAGYGTTNCTTGVAPAHVYNTSNTTAVCQILFMYEP